MPIIRLKNKVHRVGFFQNKISIIKKEKKSSFPLFGSFFLMTISAALSMKDHQYGAPLIDVKFHSATNYVISAWYVSINRREQMKREIAKRDKRIERINRIREEYPTRNKTDLQIRTKESKKI